MESANPILPGQAEELLEIIFNIYGYDFRNYARSSMQRRLARFILDASIPDFAQFRHQIVNDPGVFEILLERITVNVTGMFRDPSFFLALRRVVLPQLASYPIIKIWHAGCATGEEVYSTAILLQEAQLLNRSMIYATDINPANLEKARRGLLPRDVLNDYAKQYAKAGGLHQFSDHYHLQNGAAALHESLLQNIVFSQHNLVTDQVFNEFQLICCRNVLIYFNKSLQSQVLRLFYDSLSHFGFLALGAKESLLRTSVSHFFAAIAPQHKIFKRMG